MPSLQSRKASAGFSQAEYESLAEFRYHLARFLRRRKDAARAEGLQPQQYELLLAVSGLPKDRQPTIKEIAEFCLEHHTVVELADRLEKQGLLVRRSSPLDKRVALLHVTRSGQGVLGRIVGFSFTQLRDEAPLLIMSLRRILNKRTRR